jgi:hypothetical protein
MSERDVRDILADIDKMSGPELLEVAAGLWRQDPKQWRKLIQHCMDLAQLRMALL